MSTLSKRETFPQNRNACELADEIERRFVAPCTDYPLRDPETEIRATLKHWSDVDPEVRGLRASHVGELVALFRTLSGSAPRPETARHNTCQTEAPKPDFSEELSALLNKRGLDARASTPDFILARHLTDQVHMLAVLIDRRTAHVPVVK